MTAESAARMAKATKIARTLLPQAPAARWLESGIAEGTEDFWLAAAQAAGVRSALRGKVPSAETQALVVELIRTADGMVPA
jgi:hypothetical protein